MKLKEKKKQTAYRIIIYAAGLIILALGITLNTKCGLGVSPIISVAYSVSVITNISIGNTTLIWYSVFVLIEVIIHGIKKYGGKQIISDILQVPLSLIFTRFINLFSGCIPQLDMECKGTVWGTIWVRIIVLLIAIILTGIGAAMSLNMRIIPNPGDGIVQTVADCIGKTVGFTKKHMGHIYDNTDLLCQSHICTSHYRNRDRHSAGYAGSRQSNSDIQPLHYAENVRQGRA